MCVSILFGGAGCGLRVNDTQPAPPNRTEAHTCYDDPSLHVSHSLTISDYKLIDTYDMTQVAFCLLVYVLSMYCVYMYCVISCIEVYLVCVYLFIVDCIPVLSIYGTSILYNLYR